MHDLCGQTVFWYNGQWNMFEIPAEVSGAYDEREKIRRLKGEDFPTPLLDGPIDAWLEYVEKEREQLKQK